MSEVLNNLIQLLQLEKLDDFLFRGNSQDLGLRQVFGGQVVAQALSAAIQVTAKERKLHSCHAYFLSPGDSQLPIIYNVEILREGRNFTAMRINATQHNKSLCHVTASFQIEENGFEHQTTMPPVDPPELFPSEIQVINKLASYIPEPVRDKFTTEKPFTIHSKYINNPFKGSEFPPEQYVWFKTNGNAPIDHNIQQCLLAYFSDFHILMTALHPHKKGLLESGMKLATIDHSIWFHRPFDINDWLLYAIESTNAFGARGLSRGQIFSKEGKLIATTQQEGLIRYTPNKK